MIKEPLLSNIGVVGWTIHNSSSESEDSFLFRRGFFRILIGSSSESDPKLSCRLFRIRGGEHGLYNWSA